jgi:hypothetical protein
LLFFRFAQDVAHTDEGYCALRRIQRPRALLSLAGFEVTLIGRIWVTPEGAIPQERGLHSQTAEPFIWFMFVMPIFTIFFVVNVVWGGFILVRRQWRSGYLWLLTAVIWLVAAVIDFAHH